MERRESTLPVFVSSTFSDLKAERDALQEDVFPRLRRYCQKHRAGSKRLICASVLIPIIIERCGWMKGAFAAFQSVPLNGAPLA